MLSIIESLTSLLLGANENPSAEITDEIIATTLDTYTNTVVIDQLVLALPFLNRIMASPHNKAQNGGHRIRVPLRTRKTDGLYSFGMTDTITPQRKPVITHAWATFKQVLAYVRFNWVEERMNAGSGKVIDIISERMAATIQDAKEDFQNMLWSDGTGNAAKDFMGIQGLIPTDPRTGVIMGYDRAVDGNQWWRNWYWDGSTFGPHPIDAEPGGGAPNAVGAFGTFSSGAGGTGQGVANIFKLLETGWNSVMQGETPGDVFFISDQATYEYYSSGYMLHQHNAEIPVNEDIVKFGFGGAMYKNAPWIFDTVENGAPSGELRLINTKYNYLVKDSGGWFVWTPFREPFNQLDRAKFLLIRGNMIMSYPRKSAVWQGITDWTAAS
jgi:hypothetical protein